MFLALEGIGISQRILYRILIILILFLLAILVFIFIGISAFAIPGTFGAVINAIFPIVGGVGLSKSGED